MNEKNALYLRRRRKMIVEEGADSLPLSYVASMLKNIEALGFTCSPALIERLQTLSERDFVVLYRDCVESLRLLVGAHVAFEPMYPNFPEQVMEMGEAELYINAIMHYVGDHFGVRILPAYEKKERIPLAKGLKLKMIDLGDEEEFVGLGRKLIGAKTSISEQDQQVIAWYVKHYQTKIEALLPEDIPHKENLSLIAAQLLNHDVASDVLLSRYFRTATDVLRLAVAFSGGDVSLATATKFRSLKRKERRLLLALVERCGNRVEDMLRYKKRWIRLGERLHPGEYKKKYPKTWEAFDILRNNKPYKTFNGQVEAAIGKRDLGSALLLLQSRPGELARRLDHLLRISRSPGNPSLASFRMIAEKVSTPVLLQVMAHFEARNTPQELRSFFPKGNVAKVITIPNELPALEKQTCEDVVEICKTTLVARFRELEPLGKVYLDEALRDHLVPFSQRSAGKALRTLVRGSSLDLPPGNTIRFFLWWKEGMVNGTHTGRVDVDLSSVMYDGDWNYKEHISYTNLKSSNYWACHSGDITSAPEGACEFIDLDIPSIVNYGCRYVIMSVLSFTGQAFCKMPECFAGWMMREEPNSGEVFEPSTVVDKIDLSADTRICLPVVLDLVERKMIWADLALKRNPRWQIDVEGNKRSFVQMGKAITTLVKPSLYSLFSLHTEARGERVESKEDAETIFSLHEGITPFAIEDIMTEYL